MTIETDFVATVGAFCGGRVYPDFAPHDAAAPFVTYQQVGGQVFQLLQGGASVKRNTRMQVNVWHSTRSGANALMRQIEDALQSSPFYAMPIGALIAQTDELTQQRGAMQDFSLWWS